jgi:hypothetical protein
MKKFVSLLTCTAFLFSTVRADDAPSLLPVDNQATTSDQTGQPRTPPEDDLAISPELSDDTIEAPANDGKKQVGQAANDGSKTAGSGAGKYVLAACAIAVGVAALILVSTHSGQKGKK